MLVFIEEEYGYRYWIWDFPGSKEELISEWNAGRAPIDFYDPRNSSFRGELTQFSFSMVRQEEREPRMTYFDDMPKGWTIRSCDATAHVHEDEDTILHVDGETYHKGEAK